MKNIKLDRFPGGRFKALTMSYDDGTVHDRRLVEIFNRYDIKGTFHLNSGMFGTESYISASETTSLFNGHEISVHTVNHPFLERTPREGIIREVMDDRNALEQLAGYPVRGMSYPFGTYSNFVVELLSSLGIEYSRTVESHGGYFLPEEFLRWNPTCHHNNNLLKHAADFLDIKSKISLLYVWGHSYEFDRDNNWNLIEEFCSMIGGKSDIWYATNIEIVDYMNAIKNLRFSAGMDVVYNPSALTVWISAKNNPIEIPGGKVVKLS